MCCNIICDAEVRREKNVADSVLKLCLFTEFLLCSDLAKGTICECPTWFLVTGQFTVSSNWQIVPQGRQVWKRQGEKMSEEQRIPCRCRLKADKITALMEVEPASPV